MEEEKWVVSLNLSKLAVFFFIFYVYILYYIIQMLNLSLYVADSIRQINDHFHLLNNFVKRQLKTLARLH